MANEFALCQSGVTAGLVALRRDADVISRLYALLRGLLSQVNASFQDHTWGDINAAAQDEFSIR